MKRMKENPCEGCLKGKLNRLPMTGVINNHTTSILDVFVVDIMGPISIVSFSGKKYILLIIDVYSRKVFVALLKTKDEAPHIIQTIIIREQNQTRLTLKRYHSDNAKELT